MQLETCEFVPMTLLTLSLQKLAWLPPLAAPNARRTLVRGVVKEGSAFAQFALNPEESSD